MNLWKYVAPVAKLVETICYRQKVAGSIPEGVTWISHWHNPPSRAMALESTQPLTKVNTKNISTVVKAADT